MSRELDRWFATEILPRGAALTRYLRRVWRDQTEVPDFRQEIYIRIYESAAKEFPTRRKPFSSPPHATCSPNSVAQRVLEAPSGTM